MLPHCDMTSTAIQIFVAWVVLLFFLHLSFAFAAEDASHGQIVVNTNETNVPTNLRRKNLVSSRIVGGTNARPNVYPYFAQWMRGCG